MPNTSPVTEKKLIYKRFEKALSTYDKHATVQFRMAELLLKLINKHIENTPTQIFEIGCGTGVVTELLCTQFPQSHIIANDLVQQVESYVRQKTNKTKNSSLSFYFGDIESIPFPDNSQLICSGATLQWIAELDNVFQKIFNALSTNGLFAFSTFGNENFKEIKQINNSGLIYPTDIEMLMKTAPYFRLLDSIEWSEGIHFQSPLEVLKHMKLTGVNSVSATGWTKENLNSFTNSYQCFKTDGKGYSLTYHPKLYIFEKII